MIRAIACAAAGLAVAVACFTVGAAPLGTNIWVGPPTGGRWTDPANWKTNNGCAYTSEFLLKTNCLYNFTALQDGAVVTNDGTTLVIEGLRFNDKQGTITLFGTTDSNCRMQNEQQWLAGTGTTVNVRLRQPINWKDNDTKIILNPKEGAPSQNSGTWRIAPNPDFQPYRRMFEPCAYTKLYIGSPAPNFNLTYFNIWNYAQVVLDANFTVGQIHGGTADTGLDLNGHDLFIAGGENYKNGYTGFHGTMKGNGNVTFAGGAQITFTKAPQFTGNLRILTGDVICENAVKIPSTVHVKTDRSGILRLGGDQTLTDLSGEGTSGGVTVTNATTLTVAASAATTNTFNARLCGAMDLVKDGPGTFEMTGVNALTGAVRVANGTLTLKRPIYREGLVARWGFEDAANLLRDSGPNGFTLTRYVTGTAPVLFQTNGIDNLRGIHFSAKDPSNAWASNYLGVVSWNAGFPCGGGPRTWSVWLRPTTKCPDVVYLLRRGDWQTGKEMMLWLRSRNSLRLSINEYSDSGLTNSIQQTVSDITDGNWHHVVCTYSNKVLQLYYDGQLLEEKAMQNALNIADGKMFVIGNNDTRNASTHNYDGDMDDIQLYNRVLTAEEVADEYARRTATVSDPATILPEPVSRWRFDDASDPGKDDKGVCHLVKNTMPNAPTATPTINQRTGAFGGGALNGASLMPEGGVFPEAFPTGNHSFTVSCRLWPNGGLEWGGLLCWGDALTANRFFRFGIGNCPRRLHVAWSKKNSNATTPVKDCDRTFSDTSQNNCSNPTAWTHVVMVYDGLAKTMTLYRDGAYVVQSTGVTLNIEGKNFYVNWREGWGTSGSVSNIDDLQLFDVALSAAEVRTLTRALETGSVGPVLRPETPVTVDAGATFEVAGEGHVVQSLTGAGTLAFKDAGQLESTGAVSFGGALTGAGTLILDAGGNFRDADASAFTGNLVVNGGKAVLNRTFKPVAREVADGAEIVWIEAGTQIIFR